MKLFRGSDSFKCLCGLSMNLKKKDMYTCPNCGGVMLKQAKIKKLVDKLNKSEREITAEDIELVYKKEPEIRKYLRKYPILIKVADYALALLKLLKAPQVSLKLKALAAFCLTYLISPLDVIPDITPVVGLLDDIAVILMVVNIIGKVIVEFLPLNGQLTMEPPLLYCFSNVGTSTLSYEEGHNYRLWRLPIKEMKNYNLEIYDARLPQANKLYISHPYFYKTLIPYENIDTFIFESILDEHNSILAALGAKYINYTITELKSDSLALTVDLGNEIVAKGITVSKKINSYVSSQSKKSFDKKSKIPMKIFEDVAWHFTDFGIHGNIIKDRLLNNQTGFTFTSAASSEFYLKLDSKKRIDELDFVLSSDAKVSKYRKVSFDVEFYINEMNSSHCEKSYKEISDCLDHRRQALINKYQTIVDTDKIQDSGRFNQLKNLFDRFQRSKPS